ncbi:hypothetical protein [Endozoicomonas euniceicola]|uniref:Nucleotidyltransferase DUF2204 n=1 Tax=Endozoicomonas euniceicola TaxID=1234143 RepID=A0ABY6GTR7_9GAMM|nr:hypothetical protein [Endozoicomonas euniceicola]UYM15962.1 hypothetical protein NX720_24630 [Endozoicomonas euniceicola]
MTDFSNTPIVELAAIVANHLRQHGIRVVLVGGLAVEIYSENLYLTKDIDMVNTSYDASESLKTAMAELGFFKQGRVFVNESTQICVEFPSAPLAIGDQIIKETTVAHSEQGDIPILFATDVIKDRLLAYFHWQDRPSLVQALAIMINHVITPEELEAFCKAEGEPNQFEVIAQLHGTAKGQNLNSMFELEVLVQNEFLKHL